MKYIRPQVGDTFIDGYGKERKVTKDIWTESNMGPGGCKVVMIGIDGDNQVYDDELDPNMFDYDDEGYENAINWILKPR